MKVCNACQARFAGAGWDCPSCHSVASVVRGYPAFSPESAEQNDGFLPCHFETLANLEAASFWFRSRNHLITWALRCCFPGMQSFLEIGCGTGFVLSGIEQTHQGLTLCGSDAYSIALTFAAKRVKSAELFQMDARDIPYEGEFDVIGAFDVLEHIEQDRVVLSEMHRAIRPGGGMIVTVPQHTFLWSQTDEQSCHVRRYQARQLRDKVEAAGFDVVMTTSFVTLLFPLMMASRFRKRGRARTDDQVAELRLPRWLNTGLETVLKCERLLIRSGIRLPFGGSLLLVANKR